jgi:hypothetical protein
MKLMSWSFGFRVHVCASFEKDADLHETDGSEVLMGGQGAADGVHICDAGEGVCGGGDGGGGVGVVEGDQGADRRRGERAATRRGAAQLLGGHLCAGGVLPEGAGGGGVHGGEGHPGQQDQVQAHLHRAPLQPLHQQARLPAPPGQVRGEARRRGSLQVLARPPQQVLQRLRRLETLSPMSSCVNMALNSSQHEVPGLEHTVSMYRN